MSLKRFLSVLAGVAILCTHWNTSAGDNEPFTIDDYFELNRVTELALSSDGEMIAYVVESPSLEENNTTRTVFISATTQGAKAVRMNKLQEGRSFAWIPGTHELAYLLPVKGTVQVISTDAKTRRSRQHTSGNFPVTAFQFAPDGSSLAWLTQSSDTQIALYERLFHGNKGVVTDPGHTVVYQFVNPEWPNLTTRTSNQLWLKQQTVRNAERLQAPVPGKTTSFNWSSDASKLSIAYVDNSIEYSSEMYTSLGVYDASTGTFRSILQARLPSKKAIYYSGGEWIPGEYSSVA